MSSQRVSPNVDPDKSSEGYYEMAEVLVNKMDQAIRNTPIEGMFSIEDLAEMLPKYMGSSMLNALIKSEIGQGIILGFIIGKIDKETDEEDDEHS